MDNYTSQQLLGFLRSIGYSGIGSLRTKQQRWNALVQAGYFSGQKGGAAQRSPPAQRSPRAQRSSDRGSNGLGGLSGLSGASLEAAVENIDLETLNKICSTERAQIAREFYSR